MKFLSSKLHLLFLVLALFLFFSCSDDNDTPGPKPKEHTEATLELMKICDENAEIRDLLTKAISQAARINPDRKYNPAQSLSEFYDFVDWNVRSLPWDVMTGLVADKASIYSRVDQGVGYFWFIVDQPLDELKDRGYFYPTVEFVSPFSEWLSTYSNSWGDWLNTPESWNSTYANMVMNDEDWGFTNGWYESAANYKSFNDFFSRKLISPSVRPIGKADVVLPVDSWPKGLFAINEKNHLLYPEQLNIKTAKFSSIADLIGQDSKYKDAFANGTLTHTFLDVNDYHRYHSPVDGKLLELRKVPGVSAGGGYTLWDNDAKRYYYVNDMGFQMVETRACAIIQTEEFGLVAMLPVGMSQICSVNWNDNLTVGQQLKKGDEMGYFLFGGSDVILIFQEGVDVKLAFNPDEGPHALMGENYATLSKKK